MTKNAANDQNPVGEGFDPDSMKEEERKLKALKKANMRAVFGAGMGRISLIVVGIVFVTLMGIGAMKLFGKHQTIAAPKPADKAVVDAPGAQSADAFVASDKEARMRSESNQQRADEARASGSAFIAPPVLKAPDQDSPPVPVVSGLAGPTASPEAQRQQLQQQQYAAQQSQAQTAAAAAAAQRRQQQIADLKQFRDKITTDSVMPQILVASGRGWKGEPVTVFSTSYYTVPDHSKSNSGQTQQSSASSSGAGNGASSTTTVRPFSAGDGCYAQVAYGINTDNPGNDVVADIPLCKGIKNMKVIGKYEYKDRASGVSFTFSKLSIPGHAEIAIHAIGVDEDTFSTGIADDVDNHYFRRFGMTALASIISGVGQAAQTVTGTTTTTSTGLTAQTTTVQEPMTTGREVKIALGGAGQSLGDQLKQDAQNIKTTVKVNGPKDKGGAKSIGVIFLSDVTEEKK